MRPPTVQANKVHFQPWFVMPPSVGSTGTLFVNIRPNGSSCRPADHLESAHVHTQHIISASQQPPNNWHLRYPAFCVFTLSTDKCCLQRHTLCPHSPKLAFVRDDFLNAFRPRGINRFLWDEWCKQDIESQGPFISEPASQLYMPWDLQSPYFLFHFSYLKYEWFACGKLSLMCSEISGCSGLLLRHS